ncbi:hypothetical protein BN1080_02092 [Planococcus massiliensis]|uniref:Uncharacterized protein n=1 Tax=Planococcus massiliensis TaxID=1499687 RepID=A0A098ELI0_9BACL|nr:hypothetical protein [Planococcus massiliensis]CEG23148.1 hypothetical protein BN1080_02092 [Planococcus massiliensis]
MSESNIERLRRIKKEWLSIQIHFTWLSGKELKLFQMSDDFEFLVQQAERFEILSEYHDGALAENRRLREALEFYADAKNWSVEIIKDNGNKHRIAHVVNGDSGNIASKALEGTE